MKIALPANSPAYDPAGDFLSAKETPRSIRVEIVIVFAITARLSSSQREIVPSRNAPPEAPWPE